MSSVYLSFLLHTVGMLLGAIGLLLLTASMLTPLALPHERVLGFAGGVFVTAGFAGLGPSVAAFSGALLLLRSPVGAKRFFGTEVCPGCGGHREVFYRIGLAMVAASYLETDAPNPAFWVLAGASFCAVLLPRPQPTVIWQAGSGVYCLALLLMSLSAVVLLPSALAEL